MSKAPQVKNRNKEKAYRVRWLETRLSGFTVEARSSREALKMAKRDTWAGHIIDDGVRHLDSFEIVEIDGVSCLPNDDYVEYLQRTSPLRLGKNCSPPLPTPTPTA